MSSHDGGPHVPEEIAEFVKGVVGKGRTLDGAYENFAQKVAERAQERGLSADEAERLFDEHSIPTYVEIVVLPHNEWVKAYWVKAY
ncbi:MAG: hypothetical protein R6W48_09815 [Gaiellaceae bacterium]